MSDTTVADLIIAGRDKEAVELVARQLIARGYPELVVRHSQRFRPVGNGYPRLVALAYNHDLARAAADTDEQVAATVAAYLDEEEQ